MVVVFGLFFDKRKINSYLVQLVHILMKIVQISSIYVFF